MVSFWLLRRIGALAFFLSLFWSGVAHSQPQERPHHLVTGRCAMPAVAVGSAIYVMGGLGPTGYRGDVERIETGGARLQVSVLTTTLLPRMFHTAEASGPFIYVLGGVGSAAGENGYFHEVERLDTRDGSVSLMAPLPQGRRTAASAIVGEKIYVVGGQSEAAPGEAGERTDSVLIYDIPTDTWQNGPPMPEKKECEVLAVNGGLLALGGFDGTGETAGVQFFDIAAAKWQTLPPLPMPTSAHHGAVLTTPAGEPDPPIGAEQIVLFGDYEQKDRVQSGDPRRGKWQVIGDSGFSPRRHAAVVSIGSKIYVIGGNIASVGSYFDAIQVFDAQKLRLPAPLAKP